MDRGTWQATIHRVAKSHTRLKHVLSTHTWMNYKLFLSSVVLSMRWVYSKYLMNTDGLVSNPNSPEKGSLFFH